MKNKKGFTLIELLAVIVILAIIALIAVPIVLKIISNSKESAAVRSAEIYLDSVETFVAADQMKDSPSLDLSSNETVTVKAKELENYGLKVSGETPNDDAEITISDDGVVSISRFYIGNYQITMSEDSKNLSSTEITNNIEDLVFSLRTKKYDIRLKEDSFGIRWYTDIDTDLVNKLRASGVEIKLGTIILPYDYLSDVDEFTKDINKNYVDVKYTSIDYFEEGDFYGIVGSLTNVKESNGNRKFTARGYVTLTRDGKTTTYYADYIDNDIQKNSISLAELCYNYKQNNANEYNSLSTTLKAKIDTYAALYQ